jgi:excinuclease ABC subunit C
MIDKNNVILYIGKAKNLKNRLKNYIGDDLSLRIDRMVFLVVKLEYIVTKSEAEALFLEASLIKSIQPKYNILLKDDKTSPYILVDQKEEFPKITKYRQKAKQSDSVSFGPYLSSKDVDAAILSIQKIFKIRTCSDNIFKTRTRPCILYQIKKCSAPCVNKISKDDYSKNVNEAIMFLKGKAITLQEELKKEMSIYSENMQYELAGNVRDKIKSIATIISQYNINTYNIANADILYIAKYKDILAINVIMHRNLQNFGQKIYYPLNTEDSTLNEILSSFIGFFYQNKIPADLIYTNVEPKDKKDLEGNLSKLYNQKIKIISKLSSEEMEILDLAKTNLELEVDKKAKDELKYELLFKEIQEIFNLQNPITSIEVYDNSHIMGKFAIGAKIYVDKSGFVKNRYKKFNIQSECKTGGDDYYMLSYTLSKRIEKQQDDPLPSLFLIDGGQGQLTTALKVKEKYNISTDIIAISKGEKRNAGLEKFHTKESANITIDYHSKLMYFLQTIRDEVHNFAITSHRNKRSKAIKESGLKSIKGIGPSKQKLLIEHFGSIENIKKANISDLTKVKGINEATAKVIIDYFAH